MMDNDINSPKYDVKIIPNIYIPTRNGTKIAAELYMPDSEGKFPVVFDYYPYRKSDLYGYRRLHYYFAQRGFVFARADVRGTGDSEGFITDEYTQVEREDGYDAIEWLAKQNWCNGNVGMTGLSYGAYTALSVAMLQPPSLKAIVPEMGADDRYSDGDQFRGGARQGLLSTVAYPTIMVAMNALPPYPEYAGENWSRIWQERLEKDTPWILNWLEPQVDNEYWRQALGRRYHEIKCPTFLVGGWVDPFLNSMTRLFAELKVPKKLLMGPWSHGHADVSIPGPQVDYLREMVRWFAYWLRGDQTSIMEEPPITVYVQRFQKPERVRNYQKGFWRYEDAWPPSRTEFETLYFGDGVLEAHPTEMEGIDIYEYNPLVGLCSGPWYGGAPLVMADDQREDDSLSVCYDTPPIKDEIEVMGWPRVILHVSSTADVGFFIARLEDIAPDGTSTLVSKGMLNGTRRRGQAFADPMVPGEIYELDVMLDAASWIFETGHCISLAVSSSDWPYMWPSPKPATNSIYRNIDHSSRLILPVLPKKDPELKNPELHPPAPVPLPLRDIGSTLRHEWKVIKDVYNRRAGIEFVVESEGKSPQALGLLKRKSTGVASASATDPGDAYIRGSMKYTLKRSDMVVEAESSCTTKSDSDNFHLTVNLDVKLNGLPHFSRSWMKSVPRNLL